MKKILCMLLAVLLLASLSTSAFADGRQKVYEDIGITLTYTDEFNEENLKEFYPELGETLGDALLRPTKIYVRALRSVREAGVTIKGCSHVTGGGFYENIPRMLPDGVRACVKKDSYEVPAIFRLLQKRGNIEEHMMYNTFNMGIGMVLALKAEDADKAIAALEAMGEKAYLIGSIAAGEKGVDVC